MPLTCGFCVNEDHGRCASKHELACLCAEDGHQLDEDTKALGQTPHLFRSAQPSKRYRIRVTPVTP